MSYTIEDYMIEELDLSGNELLTYAFLSSQGVYEDTLENMRKKIGMKSLTTLKSTLKSLVSNGLVSITKEGVNFPTTYSVEGLKSKEEVTEEKLNPKSLFRHGVKTKRSLLE